MALNRRESLSGPHSASRASDAGLLSSCPQPSHSPPHAPAYANPEDLVWPIPALGSLDRDAIRETAYEIFFTSCRYTPGFGIRNNTPNHFNNTSAASHEQCGISGDGGMGSGSPRTSGVGIAPTSKVKIALGLKMLKRLPSKRMSTGSGTSIPTSSNWHNSGGGASNSGMMGQTVPLSRGRRPVTSAEIMRQQMRVTEHSDNRLRKTLMRTLVGQVARRAETIVLPLELLRHVKPSEFSDSQEYHAWQKRQLKVLEVGLLLNSSIPLEKSNAYASRLRNIVKAGESRPIDTSKNSDTMRTLCNSVVSLAWRSRTSTTPTDACHWADGYPMNIHLYMSLLQSVFDVRDETAVLDEVDELFELIKKTWTTLGITRAIHNVCFAWVLFHQYVATSEMEPDLLYGSHVMLSEVSKDAKKHDTEGMFVRILSSVLSSMKAWSEKRLHNYHDYFHRGTIGLIENILPLALTASKIMGENNMVLAGLETNNKAGEMTLDSSKECVDKYIRSSLQNSFQKILDTRNYKLATDLKEEASEALLQLVKDTEDLASREREYFSPILKKWHPDAAGVSAVVLHNCYGVLLKQFLSKTTKLTNDSVQVLQRSRKLENFLVQMVLEDRGEGEDGAKAIIQEMVPYDIDSVILKLLKQWIDEKMKKGKDCLRRAEETETWNPKSKAEPYALSAIELMKTVKEMVEDFFHIPIGITEDLIQDLTDALGHLFQEYISFAASCGSKQSYIPSLPPLTRCHRDSKFIKLFKRATPCTVPGLEECHPYSEAYERQSPRPSTSRGTQRLYIRLNSLHYLLTYIHSLDKTLTLSPRISQAMNRYTNRRQQGSSSSYFDIARSSIQAACQHVSEVAAYRLIFLDSNPAFYDSLYAGGVTNARIRPTLRIMKQNLTLQCAMLTDRARPLAVKEVMRVSFEAFLMVLLAGGNSRVFYRSNHNMLEDDFKSLKRVFSTCSEGLVGEEVVDREAESVEGVIALMGQSTDQLIEDFSIVTCETSGIGMMVMGQKLPMPPTTRRWHRSDPNTILRVLCHRNDRASKQFLKKSFQLAKRR